MPENTSYLVIGNGLAGVTAAEILRNEDTAADITVIDDDVPILRVRQHLHQIAGLAIVAQDFRADYQLDVATRELAHELVHRVHCGILSVIYAEDDFVVRIILHAMAGETLIHLRIDAAQRFKDGNRRREFRIRLATVMQKGADTP